MAILTDIDGSDLEDACNVFYLPDGFFNYEYQQNAIRVNYSSSWMMNNPPTLSGDYIVFNGCFLNVLFSKPLDEEYDTYGQQLKVCFDVFHDSTVTTIEWETETTIPASSANPRSVQFDTDAQSFPADDFAALNLSSYSSVYMEVRIEKTSTGEGGYAATLIDITNSASEHHGHLYVTFKP